MKFFVTYGDAKFKTAKDKIFASAQNTKEFDELIAYGREDLSQELLESEVIKETRGGGLWSWKPDVIWKTMLNADEGDILVYCDSGCSLQSSKEWGKFWEIMEEYDILAQRIFQRSDKWTRKEIIDYINIGNKNWLMCYQFLATVVIIKISGFTKSFIREWREIMIQHPKLVMDVTEEERKYQHPTFIENRHDQAIYSALIYKYLLDPASKNKIYTEWEHIEDFDFFSKQAIRATRLREGQNEPQSYMLKRKIKWLVKNYFLKSYYNILQSYYSNKFV